MLKNLKGNLILFLAAAVWGFAFVAQDIAVGILSPMCILAVRSFIGGIALIPVCMFSSSRKKESLIPKGKEERKKLFTAGIVCGICLCVASSFQQIAMSIYPDDVAAPARSGFITALYVVFVPVCGIFYKKKLSLNMFLGIVFAVCGLYLLCMSGGIDGVYTGDIIMFASALIFTVHILCIDKFGAGIDGVKISCIQFFICGIAATVVSTVFEQPQLTEIINALPALLYLGLCSSGIGYTCQIIGMQYSENPTVASIIMSLESVFAAIGGLIFGNMLTLRETAGCVVMFGAIIVSQLPDFRFNKLKGKKI